MTSLLDPPGPGKAAAFDSSFGRRFILTVDTEEEFDWGRPFSREGYGLTHVAAMARFQSFCEDHGVAPIYLVDYPIATSPEAVAILGPAIARGAAEVGIQLHPWVNPPFDEVVSERLSFAGNLPEALERAKFEALHAAISENFGSPPVMYRAGRYGLGPNSAKILADNGVRIDSSVRSKWDYSATGGPDYRRHPLTPYWVGEGKSLLECPLTSPFTGLAKGIGERAYPSLWRVPQLRGALARARLVERIPLSPEGTSIAEAKRGIDAAIAQDLPILVSSFHSPSLATGHTPYVKDQSDLAALYGWWEAFFAHCRARDVEAASAADILAAAS